MLARHLTDLNRSGRGPGGHLKHSEWPWAGRLAWVCFPSLRDPASRGCSLQEPAEAEPVWEESWASGKGHS